MKTHKILLILFAAFSGWCGTMNAQDTDLKKRMKDADPKVIGTRIVNKFLVTPHTRFGNPRAEKCWCAATAAAPRTVCILWEN